MILFIEDDPFNSENYKELLELNGYVVICASDGQQGVDMAMALKPDLIICDVKMPILSGFEVIRRLKSSPITSAAPFVFMSSNVQKEDIKRGLSLGADHYLAKPVTEDALINTIKGLLLSSKFKDRKQYRNKFYMNIDKERTKNYTPANTNTR